MEETNSTEQAQNPSVSANWEKDPRLSGMSQEKLRFLTEYAERVKTIPRERLLPFLLSLNGEAVRRGIRFSDTETLLIVSVLTADMDPAQKKRAEALQSIARFLGGKRE